PTRTFPVLSAIKWNPSDFAVQEGETYTVSAHGAQYWLDGGLKVDPTGYSSHYDAASNCYVALGRCRPHLKVRRRLPDANWMSLSCAVGEFVRPLVEVHPGREHEYRWMPLDESILQETVFNVGKEVQFLAKYTGQLICFANDAHSSYWNNHGELQVTVTRTSWPITAETLYHPLLPACDSAQVTCPIYPPVL
ncbi:hypothetical protein B484DRAFT_338598, partial [Ochromonadaceae sp. CCMP2298]